ncbi:MAG: response regulator [Ignavibacteria bacterium]
MYTNGNTSELQLTNRNNSIIPENHSVEDYSCARSFQNLLSAKPTVLVIDDDRKIIDAFYYLMESENCEMISATNVDEVMERIEGKHLDLIITDFMLETKSSIEIFTLIRKSHPEVPLVVMTGYPELISEKDVKNFGGNYLLTKPLELKRLRSVIRSCCNPLKISAY